MAQLTLDGRQADEKLIGVVFERKNTMPSPCTACPTYSECNEDCLSYRRWDAADGKDLMLDRYGRTKAYINLRY